MHIVFLSLNVLFAMFGGYLIYFFLKSNFSINVKLSNLVIFIVCFGIINGVVSTMWEKCFEFPPSIQFFKTFLLGIISILLIAKLLHTNYIISILSFCVIIIGLLIGNISGLFFLYAIGIRENITSISNGNLLYFIVNLIVNMVAFIFVLLMKPLGKLLSQIKNQRPIITLLIITVLIMIANLGVNFLGTFNAISFISSAVMSVLYFVTSVWYITTYQKYELKLEEENQQKFYNDSLGVTLQELRRFKHDYDNHLTVILAMLKLNKTNEAYSYVQEIVGQSTVIVNSSLYNIKNAGLFAIISSKMDKAAKQNIRFTLDTQGEVDAIPDVKISDLCEIVGIFLDNAIEASLESDSKDINLFIGEANHCLILELINSCSTVPELNKIKFDGYSSKGTDRGHGLSIVDKIIAGYKNIFNITSFDDTHMTFKQSIRIEKGL